jgi:hypothetical protein
VTRRPTWLTCLGMIGIALVAAAILILALYVVPRANVVP